MLMAILFSFRYYLSYLCDFGASHSSEVRNSEQKCAVLSAAACDIRLTYGVIGRGPRMGGHEG